MPRYLTAISQAEFVLAVGLFAAAILVYTHARELLLPLLLITLTVMAFAVARAWFWPDVDSPCAWPWKSPTAFVAVTAAFRLIRYRWARWEIGPWLLSVSMLLLHLPLGPDSAVTCPSDSALMVSLLAGLSMLLLVFDDYKLHMRRLGVVNALTSSITRAQQHGPIMATALEELKGLMSRQGGLVSPAGRRQHGHLPTRSAFPRISFRIACRSPKDDDFERTLSAHRAGRGGDLRLPRRPSVPI